MLAKNGGEDGEGLDKRIRRRREKNHDDENHKVKRDSNGSDFCCPRNQLYEDAYLSHLI